MSLVLRNCFDYKTVVPTSKVQEGHKSSSDLCFNQIQIWQVSKPLYRDTATANYWIYFSNYIKVM